MNTKETNPLFDQYGTYRAEALRYGRPNDKVGIWLACLSGACLAMVVTGCWMLVAG